MAERPTGDELTAARQAHLDAGVPAAKYYVDYSDFTLWVLRVDRVRWVGGYGRMDSATGESYATRPTRSGLSPSPPEPSSTSTPITQSRLRPWPAPSAATRTPLSATCTGVDRYGLDLKVIAERGSAYTRVGYANPIDSIDELRMATVELARRAREG